jgi:hypothetical protein
MELATNKAEIPILFKIREGKKSKSDAKSNQ